MKTKKILTLCFLVIAFELLATEKFENYLYQRPIRGIKETWHRLVLPEDIFPHLAPDLGDLRIIGITENNDTTEVPYLLEILTEKIIGQQRSFTLINTSHNAKGYYYTFDIQASQPVNQIYLDFKEKNFDKFISLEGSQDQKDWYTILQNYRVLSIKNELSEYKFTILKFSDVNFRFLRLFVPDSTDLGFVSATITELSVNKGKYRSCPIKFFKTTEDRDRQITTLEIQIGRKCPVSLLNIKVNYIFDYYRPITVEYLSDSTRTSVGWTYHYRPLTTGILSSLEEPVFKFENILTSRIKVEITNHNNTPLQIDSVFVRGNVYQLIGRFTKPDRYYLIYGNNKASRPLYDLEQFRNRIPSEITEVSVEREERMTGTTPPGRGPLFQDKLWLWLVMLIIVLSLGGVALKMLKK